MLPRPVRGPGTASSQFRAARRLIVALALATILTTGCRPTPGDDGAVVPAPLVEAVQARFGALPLTERLNGTVWAENQTPVFPDIAGRITAVHVENGDQVVQGQPLVSLFDDSLQEQVRQAEAGHRIAQAQLRQASARLRELESQARRTQSLGERQLVSEVELETLAAQVESARADVALEEARVEQAVATLAEQRDALARSVVRAPFAGTVGQRAAAVGMQVTPSTHLFTIGYLNRVEVRVDVTDNMLRYIEAGQPVQITLHVGDEARVMDAAITRISPFLNPASRSTQAEIEIANPDHWLRPGMFVPVDVLYGQSRQATLVPSSAVYTDPNSGREGVFVVGSPVPTGGRLETRSSLAASEEPPLHAVEFRAVEIIARGPMETALSRIASDEWVVTIGQDLLSTGRNEARVRRVTWDEILELQLLSREGLLERVLAPPPPRADS